MRNLLFLFLVSLLVSCDKTEAVKPEPLPELPSDTTGFLEIHVSNMVNNVPLVLGNTYTTSSNDTFNLDLLKYYISNIQLHTASGYTYTEPESYYLINQGNTNSLHLMVKRAPKANYTSISFLIGVDAPRNTSGAQTGALDPLNDMFWGWNTGYIMAKIEGHSPQSTEFTQKLVYHIGGYVGKHNGLRTVNLSFNNDSAQIAPGHTPVLNLKADIGNWFSTPTPISITDYNVVTGISAESETIADNYATMFSVISVIN